MQYSLALTDSNNDSSVSFERLLESTIYLNLLYKLVEKKDNQQRPFRQVINNCQCMRRML
jgi:hypothetical protein